VIKTHRQLLQVLEHEPPHVELHALPRIGHDQDRHPLQDHGYEQHACPKRYDANDIYDRIVLADPRLLPGAAGGRVVNQVADELGRKHLQDDHDHAERYAQHVAALIWREQPEQPPDHRPLNRPIPSLLISTQIAPRIDRRRLAALSQPKWKRAHHRFVPSWLRAFVPLPGSPHSRPPRAPWPPRRWHRASPGSAPDPCATASPLPHLSPVHPHTTALRRYSGSAPRPPSAVCAS